MYRYDDFDRALINERVGQFRDQVARYLAGELSEEEFAPLRLQNGLYRQRHAYMLRVAIPYGTLSARQLAGLATIAERYDRGYGHFTTRQNVQFNWLELERVPDLLADLAALDMHAIQTSGNCIRNITCDAYAGVAADEYRDPRPLAELLRQWSTLHPEFAFLPRKFKLALSGAAADRAALQFHDLAVRIVAGADGEPRYAVSVGGGQGRTPVIAEPLHPGLELDQLLPYLEAILRVYNLHGRRDNKYKARIKILVQALGLEAFRAEVEREFAATPRDRFALVGAELERIAAAFALPPAVFHASANTGDVGIQIADDAAHRRWLRRNVLRHRLDTHAIVVVTLKQPGAAPGDASADDMRLLADLVGRYSAGELRVTHTQNVVLPHVRRCDLAALWQALVARGLARANLDCASDVVACPGLDYCNLANARSIPLARRLAARFDDEREAGDIGPLAIRISGCVNACAHHHAANIGILGVEKGGREYYQLTLGGAAGDDAAIGERLGRAVEAETALEAIDELVAHYRRERRRGEHFLDTVRRLGVDAFREACRALDR
ncbi:MAG: nitrite/sulfite reductase [Planctomycetes bacterium]|nr:nitrite/sulfite reductase [Planctomycetota bacterium]